VFGSIPGFRKLKFNSAPNKTPVAFVDYVDANSSQLAMNAYQGQLLASSDGGSGMRIEFAKKPMLPSEGAAPSTAASPAAAPAPTAMGYPGYADPYGYGAVGGAAGGMDPAALYQGYGQAASYNYPHV